MISKTNKAMATLLLMTLTCPLFAQNVPAGQFAKVSQTEAKIFSSVKGQKLSLSTTSNLAATTNLSSSKSSPNKYAQFYEVMNKKIRENKQTRLSGGLDGGGGNAVLTKDWFKLLDVYEVEKNYPLVMGDGPTYKEHLDFVLNRLSGLSPARARLYRAMAEEIINHNQSEWVANVDMPVITDTGLTFIPSGSILVPIAIQRPSAQKKFPNFKRYTIDKEAFNLLPETSKAALILHEIIYFETRDAGRQTDSALARQLVGVLISSQLDQYTRESLSDLYQDNGIQFAIYEETASISYYSNMFDKDAVHYLSTQPHQFFMGNMLVSGSYVGDFKRHQIKISIEESTEYIKSCGFSKLDHFSLSFPRSVNHKILSFDIIEEAPWNACLGSYQSVRYLTFGGQTSQTYNLSDIYFDKMNSDYVKYQVTDPNRTQAQNSMTVITSEKNMGALLISTGTLHSDYSKNRFYFIISDGTGEYRKVDNTFDVKFKDSVITKAFLVELDSNGLPVFVMYADEQNQIQWVGQNRFDIPNIMLDTKKKK